MKDKNLHPIFAEIMDNFTGKEEQTEKEKLRDKIINYLKELTPGKSQFADLFRKIVDHNFENVVKLILEEYKDDPSGMTYCIGEVPMRLILKYDTL